MPTALFPLVVQYLHPNSLFSDSFILQLLQDMVFRWIYTPKHDISCTFSAGNSMESWPVLRHPGAPANLTHQILHSPDLGNRFQAGHKPKTSHPECRTIVVRSEMKVLAISNCDIFFWVPCFETNHRQVARILVAVRSWYRWFWAFLHVVFISFECFPMFYC